MSGFVSENLFEYFKTCHLFCSQYWLTNNVISSFQCLKESYVKALGIGIGFEVKRLDFNLTTKFLTDCDPVTMTTLKVDGCPADNWVFQETFRENHCIAVAVNQNKVTLIVLLSIHTSLFYLHLVLKILTKEVHASK